MPAMGDRDRFRRPISRPMSESRPLPRHRIARWIYLAIAGVSIGLGSLGILIPGLPTTPFLLLALWAAARSSPRLHAWLLNHRWFGPPLRNWENERAVATRAKMLAILLLIASWIILAWQTRGPVVPAVTGVLFIAVAVFLVTRPTPR